MAKEYVSSLTGRSTNSIFLSCCKERRFKRRERIATSCRFFSGDRGRALFLQLPRRLTTSWSTVSRKSFGVDIGLKTPRNNFVFVPNRLSNLFARRLEMTSTPPRKNGVWDTQRLLGVPSAILSFCWVAQRTTANQKMEAASSVQKKDNMADESGFLSPLPLRCC